MPPHHACRYRSSAMVYNDPLLRLLFTRPCVTGRAVVNAKRIMSAGVAACRDCGDYIAGAITLAPGAATVQACVCSPAFFKHWLPMVRGMHREELTRSMVDGRWGAAMALRCTLNHEIGSD